MKKITLKIWIFITCGLILSDIILFIIAPEYMWLITSLFGVITLLVAAWSFKFQREILAIIKSSFFKGALGSGFSFFLILCILGVLNFLVFKNDKSFDLTQDGYHSLSIQSQKVINHLDEELKITLFAKRGDWDHYLSILGKYSEASDKVVLTALDIDSEIAKVRFYGIEENGSALLEYKGRTVSFRIESELNIVNNIIKVSRDREINIYYTHSHGELDFDNQGKLGASRLRKYIEAANYKLKPLELVQSSVPNDADSLFIIAPRFGFLDQEIMRIRNYLEKGGNLVLLLQANLTSVDLSILYNLIQENSVRVFNSLIIDRLAKAQGSDFTTPIINQLSKDHSITRGFKGRLLFPLSLGFIEEESSFIKKTKLAWSAPSPAAWAESNITGVINGKSTLDQEDLKGPVTVSLALSNNKNQSKILLVGSGAFVSNSFESQSQNFNFLLNGLAWIMDDEGIISIERPGLTESKVMISFSQETLILFFLLICIPSLFFLLSFVFYRRNINL